MFVFLAFIKRKAQLNFSELHFPQFVMRDLTNTNYSPEVHPVGDLSTAFGAFKDREVLKKGK